MALWHEIVFHPVSVASKYEALWEAQHGRELDFYNEVRARFNKTGSSAEFLFLLARCVKASVRYNSRGGVQSKSG